MNILQIFILALIQAATEFLPVSSSGHLLFYKELLEQAESSILFDIFVHVGSLIAILAFFRRKIRETCAGAWAEITQNKREKYNVRFLLFVAVSTVVTFCFYLVFRAFIETEYTSARLLPVTFLFTSLLLFSTLIKRNIDRESVARKRIVAPIIVGLFQGIAILPGVSRSGATISTLLFMGVEREDAAYYSFFLAIPAILGALMFKLLDLGSVDYIASHWGILLLSFLVSAFFSFLFLALLNTLVKKGRFWLFGFYTLGMAVASFVLFV